MTTPLEARITALTHITRITKKGRHMTTNDEALQALRSSLAQAHKISDADRDLFLTGRDADTLVAQAVRLVDMGLTDRRTPTAGNRAPKEGRPVTNQHRDERDFLDDVIETSIRNTPNN